jgi:hypothetical protein
MESLVAWFIYLVCVNFEFLCTGSMAIFHLGLLVIPDSVGFSGVESVQISLDQLTNHLVELEIELKEVTNRYLDLKLKEHS